MLLFHLAPIAILSVVVSAKILHINETDLLENQQDTNGSIIFDYKSLDLVPEGDIVNVSWTTTVDNVAYAIISVEDQVVAKIFDEVILLDHTNQDNITASGSFKVETLLIGYNTINVTLYDENGQNLTEELLNMTVMIFYKTVNDIFINSLAILLALTYINMGATIDLELIKRLAKRPVGPVLGMLCQYLGMPLLALGLGFLLFNDDPIFRIGVFMAGCVPGGGLSNVWTLLLGGSLDLSVMMTFTSTVSAFAVIPAWILFVGPFVLEGANFSIPFSKIALFVASLVLPLGIGLIIQKYVPRFQKFLEWTLGPFSIFCLLYISTFGIYAYRYIFNFTTQKVVGIWFLLPNLGFLLGLLSAKLCGQSRDKMIAISIETGLQNGSIAVLILNFVLPQPAGKLASIIPSGVAAFTPVSPFIVYFLKISYVTFYKEISSVEENMILDTETTVMDKKQQPVSNIEITDEHKVSGGMDNLTV